ncbi:MAG: hypothetical protein KDI90_11355 [Alphaproteobacteria bacterium]|nr:hypothetical protein [Alphaproteobacteria bacterium]MCB9974367.1 hypothetical protein [Rhodospirillales bacterium]
MRGVLNSRDLQAKHEFQDLAYRLMKMREEMYQYFARLPDVQQDVARTLESTSALFNGIQSYDSSITGTLQTCEGNIQQIIRRIINSTEFYAAHEREPAERTVRILNKIISKLRSHEDAINRSGIAGGTAVA